MHKSPKELKAAMIAYTIFIVIGIAFWVLVIWGLYEGVVFLSHLNGSN